ncbi:hypothetical protein V7S43_017867 [Phytophthora oleae]|uniref:Uncharacterized protein n=1 Tax=Phytophthora oleae TaxID=2107226 RepID=A0ABD3ESB0_9STRA
MTDHRREHEWTQIPMPKNKYASNGEKLHTDPYSQSEVLLDFSCEQHIEFDTLLPLYITPLGRLFEEPRFNSSRDVVLFVLNMPVKEMHDLHDDIYSGKEESVHNFLWILQWLETSMEISETTRPMLRSDIHYLNATLVDMGKEMDSHVEEFIAMRADLSVDADTIEKHRLAGFKADIKYHRMSRLSIAADIIDMLADYLENKLPRCV